MIDAFLTFDNSDNSILCHSIDPVRHLFVINYFESSFPTIMQDDEGTEVMSIDEQVLTV